MKRENTHSITLRQKAEEQLKEKLSATGSMLSESDALKLVNELHVRQIELEMLNEELKSTEETLRKRNVFCETLLKTIPFGMDIVDENGTVLFQSDNFKEIFGESAIGKKCWALYRDDKEQCCDCPLKKGIIIGETNVHESQDVLGNRIFEINHTGMMYEGRKAMLEIFQDITERKHAEEELIQAKKQIEEREAVINAIVESTSDWIWEVTEKGIYCYCSEKAEQILGYTVDEIVGKSPFDFMPEGELKRVGTIFQNKVQACEPICDLENWNIHKDGHLVCLLTNGVPKFDKNGKLIGYVGADKDITERKQIEQALKESEEKLLLLMNSAAEGIYGIDMKGDCTYANKSCIEYLGYKIEKDLIGKNMHDLIHHSYSDNRPMNGEDCKIYLAFRQGLGTHVEDEVLWRADATSFPVEYYSHPILKNEQIIGAVVTFTDITERRQQEKELDRQKELLQNVINHIPIMIACFNKTGEVTMTNNELIRNLGWTNEEWETENIFAKCYPEAEYFKEVLDFMGGKNTGWKDFKTATKYGTIIDASWSNIKLTNGVSMGFGQDITQRKNSELIIKNINERFALATLASGISVWEHDYITDTIKTDDNFSTIYGSPQGNYQIEFTEFIKFIHPDDVDIIKINFEEAIKSDKSMSFEFRIIRPDGDIRNINAYGKIVKDITNKPVKFIGVNIDISDFRRAELRLKDNERYLQYLNADKDRFISILGHDLRSPFSALLSLSYFLNENITEFNLDEIKGIAGDINSTAQSTFNLLDDILLWARTQQGNLPFKPQNLSFTYISKNIFEIFNPIAKAKNIAINYSSSDNLNVFADADMLKTIIRNLVSNAIKFTNSGGVISIVAEQSYSTATISISDSGVGISPDNMKKLFDIGQVLTTSGTEDEKGTGFGLLLCKEFVEKHGGKIWVESEEGRGSTFYFTIPFNPVSE